MRNRPDGEPHDDRQHPRAPGRAEDHADAGPEGAMAQLFDTEPPPFNRRYLENRIAYRIQELAYGGLKPETIRRLEMLGEQYDSDNVTTRRIRHDARPVAGTRLVREYQRRRAHRHGARRRLRMAGPAVPLALRHRPRDHRHPLERARVLRPQAPGERGMTQADHPQAPLRGLHPQVHRGGAGAGVQLAPRPARGLRGLRRQPALRGLGADPRALRRRRLLRRHAGAPGAEAAARRHRGGAGRRRRGLQDRPAVALADGLLEAGRGVRPRRRHLRLGHPVVQHHDLDGAADAQHPALLRPVRARGHRRAHPRQDQGVAAEGHVHGRQRAARLRREGPEAGGADEAEAAIVRSIFERFVRIGSATVLARELRHEGVRTKRGKLVDKGYLYKLLNNRTYLGLAVHKGTAYPGEHAAIIDQELWDKVHAILAENTRTRSAQHPGADAGAAEGADLRADRRGDVADAHAEGQPALPLLRQPGRAEARAGGVPGRSRAGGGDRGGGHRPAARHLPAAGDHRRHMARGAGRAGRHHRGRGAGGAAAARPAVGRAVPGRAGADRAAAGRAGRCADRRRGASGCGRTGSPGWCARSRARGRRAAA